MKQKSTTCALAIATAGLALTALTLQATAADLRRPGSLKDFADDPPIASRKLGYYATVRGAITFPDDTSFSVLGLNVDNDYDTGFAIGGAFGLNLYETSALRLRGDLEFGYNEADIDAHTITTLGTFSGDAAFGSTSVFYGLANLVLDIKTGTPFTPYISAGGGFGNVDFDGHGVSATGVVLDDSDTGYAFQAGAGLAYDFGTGLSLDVGYRYFGVFDIELEAIDGSNSSTDIQDHQILIGLRQSF
ncbi:MAG: outer membrane beta-barrel protein [Pseudomonadota bacterium]